MKAFTVARLDRALRAERDADAAAADAERLRRETWWEVTWLLAECPRVDWSTAQARYMRTGRSASSAQQRARVGRSLPRGCFPDGFLPPGRLAQVTVEAKLPMDEAIARLQQAEADELSLREFSEQVTGKVWSDRNTDEQVINRAAQVLTINPAARRDLAERMRRSGGREQLRDLAQEAVLQSVSSDDEETRQQRRSHAEADAEATRFQERRENLHLGQVIGTIQRLLREAHAILDHLTPTDDDNPRSLADDADINTQLAAHLAARLRGESVVTDEALAELLGGAS